MQKARKHRVCGVSVVCCCERGSAKVGASDEKLAEIAQLTKYKLRLKEEYESAYAEYRKDYVPRSDASVFRMLQCDLAPQGVAFRVPRGVQLAVASLYYARVILFLRSSTEFALEGRYAAAL